MFGWFAHALAAVCPQFHTHTGNTHWLHVRPDTLASCLPLLGSVLYLPMHADGDAMEHPAHGWLVDQAELMPLLRTRWLATHCVIGAEGPREWVECIDAEGRLRARLHLLPDTDYLAWDVLLTAGTPQASPVFRRVLRPFRPACARLVNFRHQRLGGLHVLGSRGARRLSSLGQGIAREVARADALELAGGA
ncbi:hypothetical protein [Dyella subtropica]|uniref:hypothetical protein n=1 Tax=Dyella subtropica TaxID=2992127 RepID=UPI00225A68A0|nr:hypothetical protein [Dyella subtropica]